MFFDDRLATVLRQNAQSDAMRRTQYRQLLDLLGAQSSGVRKAARDPSLVAAAWMRMNKLAETIPASERARLISEPGWRLRNPELVAHLADFEPDIASAALSRAQLSSEDWTALIPRLPVRARGFLRLRRDLPENVEAMLEQLGIYDRGLPTPQTVSEGLTAGEKGAQDDAPLDLDAGDELPGSDIASEELPAEPLSREPAKAAKQEESDLPIPTRPIFFPKEKEKGREETAEDEGYTPEPFTIEELREIAEEPLGKDDLEQGKPIDADRQDSNDEPLSKPSPKQEFSDTQADGRSEISALVERISNFQRARQSAPPSGDHDPIGRGEGPEEHDRLMPRLPLGEEDNADTRIVRGFAFAADATGRIEWAAEEVAPMIVGTRLINAARLRSVSAKLELVKAFNQRQPIKAAPFALSGAPAIAGDWVVDAQPRFSQIGGFAGYIGRMRKPIEAAPAEASPAQREADRIRQLLHELRTPVTAVQGYSEVIQQQLFGSAPHEYRALAAAIASDAARILSGFEELDRLSRLETGILTIDKGMADIAELAKRFVRQLSHVLDARMAGITLKLQEKAAFSAAIDQDNAESLLWRLLASLGGACAAGETVEARLELKDDLVNLTCDLPMQMLGEEDLFAADARPSATAINPGIFGAGFALRLARAEARAASGDLARRRDKIVLTLPKAVQKAADQSPYLAAN